MTAPVLNNADMVVFLVSGKEKAAIMQKVLEGSYQPGLLPSQLIHPKRGGLLWIVDRSAAGRLTLNKYGVDASSK